MEYYSAIKKNTFESVLMRWMELEPIQQGEISQKEKHQYSISSVQFSRSVVSDSLPPQESQHARPPCPSPTPGVNPTHVHQVSDATQPSHPLSSPSPPAPNPSQLQSLFQ